MAVFMAHELPDLPDFTIINRAVPQMPTGMEKEEETVCIITFISGGKSLKMAVRSHFESHVSVLAPNLKMSWPNYMEWLSVFLHNFIYTAIHLL